MDNTIAKRDSSQPVLNLGVERQSVNNGDTYNFVYQSNIGEPNLSKLAYKDTQLGNFDIPNGAIIHDDEEHAGKIMQARKRRRNFELFV